MKFAPIAPLGVLASWIFFYIWFALLDTIFKPFNGTVFGLLVYTATPAIFFLPLINLYWTYELTKKFVASRKAAIARRITIFIGPIATAFLLEAQLFIRTDSSFHAILNYFYAYKSWDEVLVYLLGFPLFVGCNMVISRAHLLKLVHGTFAAAYLFSRFTHYMFSTSEAEYVYQCEGIYSGSSWPCNLDPVMDRIAYSDYLSNLGIDRHAEDIAYFAHCFFFYLAALVVTVGLAKVFASVRKEPLSDIG